MGTGIYLPLSALLFSVLIMLMFFVKGHINTFETKLYGVLIITNFVGLILELLCTVGALIYDSNRILADFLLKSYLLYLVAWALLFTVYVFYISHDKNTNLKIKGKALKLVAIFYFICVFFIYALPINLIVENDFSVRYTTGASVNFTYVVSLILVGIMLYCLLRNIKKLATKKYIPLIVFKNEQGGRNNIYNAIYSTSCQTAVADDKGNYYRVPILSHIKGHAMRNLFKYDANVFEKQIFEADFNLITESSMNMAGLSLIHAYDGDEEHDPNLLKIADRLYTKLIKMFGEKNIYIINKMQIKKRQNLFGAKEIEVLSKMKCDDEKEKCGKYILLGDEKMLKQSFGQLCLADKEEFKTYPIYMLHMEHEEKVGMVKAN